MASSISLDFIFRSGFPLRDRNLVVPPGRFAQVLHDFELPPEYKPRQLTTGFPDPVNKPLPATCPTDGIYNGTKFGDTGQPLSKEWQFWLFNFLKWQLDYRAPDGEVLYHYEERKPDVPVPPTPYTFVKCTENSVMQAYVNLVEDHRAFTDTNAPENGYTDYVTGRNLSANKPYKWKPLLMNGNIIKIVGEYKDWYIFEALDFLKPPPTLEYIIERPWLYQWATEQTTVKLPDGRWVVSSFPQIKVICDALGFPRMGTAVPIGSLGGVNWVKKSRVRFVSGMYSPYV